MPSRGQPCTLSFVVWDTVANLGKVGDTANVSLKWVKDGVPATPTNAPVEVDAANIPGVCKLSLTAAECTCDVGTLAGKSATAGVVVIPLTLAFEQLPTAAPGTVGGLPTAVPAASDVVAAVFAYTIETGATFRDSIRDINAATHGKSVAGAPGVIIHRSVADDRNRLTADILNGYRTSVTRDHS